MPSLLSLAAPFALFLPLVGQGIAPAMVPKATQSSGPICQSAGLGPDQGQEEQTPYSAADVPATSLEAFHDGQIVRQVRIDQRVVIRISPQRQSTRSSLLARLPQRGLTTRYEEREMARCVPVSRISGVQTGTGNRLLLFLSDERIVSLNLERACRARDFYSGFYVERSEDGQLCVDRDQLQSRSGAKCEVEAMRQLVAVGD